MYERAVFALCLLALVPFQSTASCDLRPVLVQVPKRLPAGFIISEGKKELSLKGCAAKPVAFTSSDPDFAVNTDGTIFTVHTLEITTKRFSVLVQDENGSDWRVDIILSCNDGASHKSGSAVHKRAKRRWRPLPFSVVENDKAPFPKELEMIASDSSVNYTVHYRISGQGVDKDPIGLFILNEQTGMLSVTGPVDRERNPQFDFVAQVFDKSGKETDQYLPITVIVEDVNDNAPEFTGLRFFTVEERCRAVIGTYKALDPENKNSDGIKYYKMSDPGNWINVVENTGELRVANTIDRESPLVQKDMYNITVRAVDGSKKTGKGMVVIQIEDTNDNMPAIGVTDPIMCSRGDTLSSILIEAQDMDRPPYSTPFSFELGAGQEGSWKLKDTSDSSVVLEQASAMPNGLYSVPILVKDLQGNGKEQIVNVRVCNCEREENGVGICGARSASSSLGGLGILALVLSGLLLLLLSLFLIFMCSTKRDKLYINDDTGTGGMLLKSNTEAPGEEVKDGALMMIPGAEVVDGSLQSGIMESKNVTSTSGRYGPQYFQGGGVYNTTTQEFGTEKNYSSGRYDNNMAGNTTMQRMSNTGASDTWKTNGRYLDRKLTYFGEEEDGRYADDVLKTYGNEGMGSPAGSVGCCSIVGEQESLDFLNTLGPKFRPLADVCYTTTRTGN
ncbi:desmocollin 2-like protein [Garra rufa]|uniref:desmocollin 2-like protein n=1 Tax=Garra rufa TaxID=137080 RepID=UPI003CCE76F1